MPKIKWTQVTKAGKLPLFLMCAFPYYFREDLLGKFLETDFNILYYKRISGATFFNQKEWDNYLKLIKAKEDESPGYLLKLGKEFEKRNKKIVRFCKKYQKFNFSKLKIKEIENIYRRYIDLKKKWLIPDYTYYIMDRYLPEILIAEVSQKLTDRSRFNKVIEILTGLDRPTLIREEKLQILRLASLVKGSSSLSKPKIQNQIKSHVQKYGFLNYYFYYSQPYTTKDIERRIKEVLSKDLKEEIRKIKLQDKNRIETQKIIQELKLSKKAQLIIKTLKQWGYCLNSLDETGCLITYYFKNFLLELAKRMRITYEMLVEMLFEEIDKFFEDGFLDKKTKNNLRQRVRGWALIWQGKTIKIYSGEELKKLKQREEKKRQSKIKNLQIIKGVSTSAGEKIKGKVRILESYQEISLMKKGEILVTSKTTPKFVPAMEKATGIITDEGGLLSHAAVVSRELKIPCIVGTKIATRFLKNGDFIEMDANKGVIKIL